jgi:hypothetical protein
VHRRQTLPKCLARDGAEPRRLVRARDLAPSDMILRVIVMSSRALSLDLQQLWVAPHLRSTVGRFKLS